VTANDFRRVALALPETAERLHMDHPDFRVSGKIFATLGYPDKAWGMVKLTPEQQHYFLKDNPDVFVPAKGAWGRRGATTVRLKAVSRKTLHSNHCSLAKYRSEAPRERVPWRAAMIGAEQIRWHTE
jgi:YjbR